MLCSSRLKLALFTEHPRGEYQLTTTHVRTITVHAAMSHLGTNYPVNSIQEVDMPIGDNVSVVFI